MFTPPLINSCESGPVDDEHLGSFFNVKYMCVEIPLSVTARWNKIQHVCLALNIVCHPCFRAHMRPIDETALHCEMSRQTSILLSRWHRARDSLTAFITVDA